MNRAPSSRANHAADARITHRAPDALDFPAQMRLARRLLMHPDMEPQEYRGIGMGIIDTVTVLQTNRGQPSDFPPDQLIRMHLNLVAYTDDSHTMAYGDADPTDNSADFWFKRECGCE